MLNISCPFSADKHDGSEVFNMIKSFFDFAVRHRRLGKRP